MEGPANSVTGAWLWPTAALCGCAVCLAGPVQETTMPPAAPGKQWRLTWHDEFDGTKLDAAKWQSPEYERRGHLWRAANAWLDGKGHLVLETSRVGDRFASPCVRTRDRYEKAFGYFVCRARLPSQPGHWSAFWLFNDCVGKVGNEGRDGTEIDIMEWPYRDGRLQQTLHWDGYGREHRSQGNIARDSDLLNGQFHTFSLLWTPEEYVFYVDGGETWRTRAGGVCQVPLYIKLSEEIGPWAGDIKTATLPDHFVVDYVRVYDLVTPASDPAPDKP